MRHPLLILHPTTYLTSHEVGALLQTNPSSINKWVEEGRIEAYRTPGGHRRIRVDHLVAFLTEYKMPIPDKLKFETPQPVVGVRESKKKAVRKK